MVHLGCLLKGFVTSRRAITSVEYALILALIAGGTMASVIALNEAVSTKMHDSATCIESDNPKLDCN